MRREGIGSPLYPDNLFLASEAAKYLLPKEVTDNLTKGTPITTNTDQFGELKPYFYGEDFVSAVAGYVIGEETLYSSEQFRYNVLQFLKTFGLPEDLYVFSKKTIQSHEVSMYRRQVPSPNFYTVDTIPEHGRKSRIFMHGRFNGFPHPANIETFINLRKQYPNSEICCGVDTDKTSIAKGQFPFMDPLFRASALYATGLIYNVIYLDPPDPSDKDNFDDFWSNFYHLSGNVFDPDIIVVAQDELAHKKEEFGSIWIKYIDPERFQKTGNVHQTTLKDGTYPMKDLRNDWNIIREELADLTSTGD
jgi:hypothetical protein